MQKPSRLICICRIHGNGGKAWEEHKKTLPIPPKDEVYSFAYWLYRYSGLIKPVE